MNLPTVQINRILYATDLSETAAHAFAYASSLARMYGARISILHVMAEFPGEQFITNMVSTDTWEGIKNRHYSEVRNKLIGKRRDHAVIQEVLQAFSEEVQEDDKAPVVESDDILIKNGAPADVIVETAQELECDLVVMGTHGQGAITDVLVGSTAKRVVRQSPVPVLVVRLP